MALLQRDGQRGEPILGEKERQEKAERRLLRWLEADVPLTSVAVLWLPPFSSRYLTTSRWFS